MPLLPNALEIEVVRRLYEDAQRLDWLHLSMAARRVQYVRWVENPAVGGVLTQFVPASAARVWIKDGPMKEFSRACAGVGRFASFVPNSGHTPEEVLRASLGSDWVPSPGSIGVKPLHCTAESGAARQFVCWGRPGDYKHLLWAAIRAAEFRVGKARIVLIESLGHELRGDRRQEFKRLAVRCGVDFDLVRLK
ncbi:MAG: hypothetical protein EXQ69_09175 [Acidimicrobiia bacterium]|nr:hypothetical protein [Acidimicrobiia bacterium]